MSIVPRNGSVYCEDDEDDDIATLICKRARISVDELSDSKRPLPDIQDISSSTGTRVLLRRVYFLNYEKTQYVSVGFYLADSYQVLQNFEVRELPL